MSAVLLNHIRRYIPLSEEGYNGILPYFTRRTLNKKENLLSEGNTCRDQYFVEKGLLRMYFVGDTGVEQTTQFALETWWIADYTSFNSQKPATFNIQAVERSEVLVLSHDQQEKLLTEFPVMERYFRMVHQRAHAAAQFRIGYQREFSREELYHHFAALFPEFVQRVPQYLIASYLGFTPEYLSEIRARKRS